jgi:hypothetical protein
LRQRYDREQIATPRNSTGSTSNSRRHKYTKVLDNRKQAIRRLWRRNGKFIAWITIEDEAGRKVVNWVPLNAETAAEAQEAFRLLQVERDEDSLRHKGRCPSSLATLSRLVIKAEKSGDAGRTSANKFR